MLMRDRISIRLSLRGRYWTPMARAMTPEDAAQVTELFALAFYDDPTWSWALPRSRHADGRPPGVVGALRAQRDPLRLVRPDGRRRRRGAVDPARRTGAQRRGRAARGGAAA